MEETTSKTPGTLLRKEPEAGHLAEQSAANPLTRRDEAGVSFFSELEPEVETEHVAFTPSQRKAAGAAFDGPTPPETSGPCTPTQRGITL